jgi:hypothetical protein
MFTPPDQTRAAKQAESEFHSQLDGEIRQALQLNASAYRRVMKQAEKNLVQSKSMNEALERTTKKEMSAATRAAEEAMDLLNEARKNDS